MGRVELTSINEISVVKNSFTQTTLKGRENFNISFFHFNPLILIQINTFPQNFLVQSVNVDEILSKKRTKNKKS